MDEDFESERLEIDLSSELHFLISELLKKTISVSIDEERHGAEMPIPKEKLLESLVEFNMSRLEDDCFMTLAPDGKIHLCGTWLMRPVMVTMADKSERMVPMMFVLQKKYGEDGKIEYHPNVPGAEFRKRVWGVSKKNASYDLPVSCKVIDDSRSKIQLPSGMVKGPPAEMGKGPPGFSPPVERPVGFGPPVMGGRR